MAYEQTVGFSSGTIVKLYFGGHWAVDRPDTPAINFGLPPTVEALELYLAMMHGSALPWVVSVFGDAVLETPLARRTFELGGHLRVGIEDAAGRSTMGNVEMVRAAVALAADVGRTAVQGAEAAATLRKGHPHLVEQMSSTR
jgi:3-keto-5-aminohexanoate cleavage enzyme